MSKQVKLWCLLFLNDATHHTLFHITIRDDKTVDDLKEAIKSKDCHTGKHYNATKLLLYKASAFQIKLVISAERLIIKLIAKRVPAHCPCKRSFPTHKK